MVYLFQQLVHVYKKSPIVKNKLMINVLYVSMELLVGEKFVLKNMTYHAKIKLLILKLSVLEQLSLDKQPQ